MSTTRAFPSIRKIMSTAALASAFAVAPSALADTPPDLIALSVSGPGQTQIGTPATVNLFVVNLGGPLVGSYTANIYLSTDTTIDVGDTLFSSVSSSFVGALTTTATVPESLSAGIYNFLMRIEPAAGETVTFNNDIIGNSIAAFTVDLQVEDASPIAAFATADGNDPPTHILAVKNGGSEDGILVFTAAEYPAVDWLSITPTSSFALANNPANQIEVRFDVEGLAPGVYQTQIALVNFNDVDDHELIPVTLTVGKSRMNPGDRLIGEVETPGEKDEVAFDAIAGMKVRVRVQATSGDLKPKLSLIDPSQNVIKEYVLKHSARGLRKNLVMPTSGEYTLRIEGANGTVGDYLIQTSRKLPKKAKPASLKIKPTNGANVAYISLLGLPLADLDFVVAPTKSFKAQPIVSLKKPDGFYLDISANTQAQPNRNVVGADVMLAAAGEYVLEITGFVSPKETLKVKLVPTQPAAGNSSVLLP
jgi:hypothetical protein